MVSISALKECVSVNSSENAFMSAFMLGIFPLDHNHTGQYKRTGGCYNKLVVAFLSTCGGVKSKKIYTC